MRDLNELFYYNPKTGKVYWKVTKGPHAKEGKEITYISKSPNKCGVHKVKIDGQLYLLHRVIWKMMTGRWPKDQIDHINGDSLDNRWCNLREVTSKENSRNVSRRSNNTSGVTGVYWHKRDKVWHPLVVDKDGNFVHLGYYDNFEDAVRVRKEAEKEYGYHENHDRDKPYTN